MSKMQEAFEKWLGKCKWYRLTTYGINVSRDAFEAGYQAAIAAVKEGGAYGQNEHEQSILKDFEVMARDQQSGFWPRALAQAALTRIKNSYKLPED